MLQNTTADELLQIPSSKPRRLYLHDGVTEATMHKMISEINEINEHDAYITALFNLRGIDHIPRPIVIDINSPGGGVYPCLGLIGVMDKSTTPIHTVVSGYAFSCGFIIAISGHKRFAHQYATLMYHQVSANAAGKIGDMAVDLAEYERLQTVLEGITLKRTKLSAQILKDTFDRKVDLYLDANKALSLGCIDEIVA